MQQEACPEGAEFAQNTTLNSYSFPNSRLSNSILRVSSYSAMRTSSDFKQHYKHFALLSTMLSS